MRSTTRATQRRPILGLSMGLAAAVILGSLFPFGAGHAPASAGESGQTNGTAQAGGTPGIAIAEYVEAIRLHVVNQGALSVRIIDGAILGAAMEHNRPFDIEGHVCGMVILCRPDIRPTLENRRMSKIRRNPDGSFSVRHFGVMAADAFNGKGHDAGADNAYYEGAPGAGGQRSDQPQRSDQIQRTGQPQQSDQPQRSGRMSGGGFSFFPKVAGDAVWPGVDFRIRFTAGDAMEEARFHQRGYADRRLSAANAPPVFRYRGNGWEALRRRIPDIDHRIAMIREGIARVETALSASVARTVILIDYQEVHNALTFPEDDAIWFYSKILAEESPEELSTIAAHETLHKYVDARRLTRAHSLRRLFADLRGLGDYSPERFLIETQGLIPNNGPPEDFIDQAFFALINERNFIPNRKGGHSHENMDEFWASFLHSLLNVEHLAAAIGGQIVMPGESGYLSATLSPGERAAIMDRYLASIRALLDLAPPEENGMAAGKAEQRLLERALRTALSVRDAIPADHYATGPRLSTNAQPHGRGMNPPARLKAP